MTTFTRKLRRAAHRRSGSEWPSREQPTVVLADGGYRTLRPRKGWLVVSAARLRAQARLRHIVEVIEQRKAMAR